MNRTIALLLAAFVWSGASGCRKADAPPSVDFSQADSVNIILGDSIREHGLHLIVPEKKNRPVPAKAGGADCQRLKRRGTGECYLHFRIDPAFKLGGLTNVLVAVEYFDATFGEFDLEYDGREAEPPDRSEKGRVRLVVYPHGEYTPSQEKISLQSSAQWRTAEFHLANVRFENSQDANADFRLRLAAPEFFVRRVSVHRRD